jgi:hypothetical protein
MSPQDTIDYLRQMLAQSKATEMDARHQLSGTARALNKATAERDRGEQVIRNLEHELKLRNAEIARLRSLIV